MRSQWVQCVSQDSRFAFGVQGGRNLNDVQRGVPPQLHPLIWFWVSGFGLLVSGVEFPISGFGLQVSSLGFPVSGFGFRGSCSCFRVSGFTFRVSGSWFGFCDQGPGFECCRRVKGEGDWELRIGGKGLPQSPRPCMDSDFGPRVSVSGFGFRVSDFGFRVSGFGFRVLGLEIWDAGFGFACYTGKKVQGCMDSWCRDQRFGVRGRI